MSVLLIASLGLAAFGQSAPAQQPASRGSQSQSSAAPAAQEGLENSVLEEADEDRNITYMDSTVSFEYRHEALDGGITWDNFELQWQQSFGRSGRFAAKILLPFIRVTEEQDEPGASGEGDDVHRAVFPDHFRNPVEDPHVGIKCKNCAGNASRRAVLLAVAARVSAAVVAASIRVLRSI